MTNSGAGRYYWCVTHHRVESESDGCRAVDRLGPYPSAAQAERALETVHRRNEAWDTEDARWTGEDA
jgi:hypothetical protein